MNNSTANPGYAASQDIWMYYQTVQTTLQNVRVRWAQNAIRYDGGGAQMPKLTSAILEDSLTGIYVNIGGDTLSLTSVTSCNVVTPTYIYPGSEGSISGSITQDCGVVSVAMVNDPNRDRYDYDTNKNSQSECSFAVLDSTNIVAAFMNTHLSEYGLAAGGNYFPGIPSPRMTSWAISSNGGATFTDKGPLLPISTITLGGSVITNGASDPMHGDVGDTTMAYDSVSNVAYLLVNTSREQTNYHGFRLWTSKDQGQTFNPVNMDVPGLDANSNHLVNNSDKPMIKASGTNVYVAGSGTISNLVGVWAARSTNQGTNWTSVQVLESQPSGGYSSGTDIATAADGTVYVVWLQSVGSTNQFRYAWLSTNDVWSYPTNIGLRLNSTNTLASGRPLRFKGSDPNDYFGASAFPRVAYANGKIYIAYGDLPSTNNGTTDQGDIFLLEANVNWTSHWLTLNSGPRKVNNDTTQTDQWNPSIAANTAGTELFIGYYSRQEDPVTNSWIKAYGAKTYITNGSANATFECVPIGLTNFLPMFAGTNAPSNTWAFDPVWPPACVCLDPNAVYANATNCDAYYCPHWPGSMDGFSTYGYDSNFCADDYTWCSSDSNYFYFAWCDRSRTNGTAPNTRPDADIRLAKVKQ